MAREAVAAHGGVMTEFHVAPQVTPAEGLPYHSGLYVRVAAGLEAFAATLDAALQAEILITRTHSGAVLRPAVVTSVPADGFTEAMRKRGKLGGQNKLPRLANDRTMADLILESIAAT